MRFKISRLGFSLMEVVIAIGILSFAMIPLVGLIPMGLKNTKSSSEETHALNILTMVIQDFRYTPLEENKSGIFKLSNLPYRGTENTTPKKVWIDLCMNVYPHEQKPQIQAFEVEWIYTKIPSFNSFLPIEARFTVRWPPKHSSKEGTTDQTNTGGEFSTTVSFSKP